MNLRYTLLVAFFAATTTFAQTEFITVWKTTTANETITISTWWSETYNYTVDWGDGMTSTNQTGDATHPYANPGQYTVKITGTFPRIHFNFSGDRNKILEVSQWGTQAWASMERAFYGCNNLNITATDIPDLTNLTSLNSMFYITDLTTASRIEDWDVSKVTDMRSMFRGATAFNQDLSNWDISKVTDIRYMFNGVTLSTANYDSMLDNWSKQLVKSNLNFHGGNSKYCTLGEAGKIALQNKGWTFTDGGKDSATICATLSIENPQQNAWTLYPNPVESRIYISGSTAPQRIQVFGIDGKKHKDIQDANSLEVEQLKAGLYMVKLIGRENTEVFKVIKR